MNTSLHLAVAALILNLGCSCTATRTDVTKESSSDSTTSFWASVSIKDLIAMLPAYSYHEGSIEDAKQWLHDAKIERADLNGIFFESVFYPADGCRGATRFYLDRETGRFWEYYYGWEPNAKDIINDTHTEYKIFNGKLIIKSQRDIPRKWKNPVEQVGSSNGGQRPSLNSGFHPRRG
jgi:hypothetical protein